MPLKFTKSLWTSLSRTWQNPGSGHITCLLLFVSKARFPPVKQFLPATFRKIIGNRLLSDEELSEKSSAVNSPHTTFLLIFHLFNRFALVVFVSCLPHCNQPASQFFTPMLPILRDFWAFYCNLFRFLGKPAEVAERQQPLQPGYRL